MAATAQVRIKPATEEDVPLILTFIRELADYEKLVGSVTATEERLRATLFGPQPFAEAIIAYDRNEPVAFAVYFCNYSTFTALPGLYLEDIFVRPASRSLGVGRQIFSFLACEAVRRGCDRMQWAVLDWNQPAISFYQRLAAEPVKDWTVFRLGKEKLDELAAETA